MVVVNYPCLAQVLIERALFVNARASRQPGCTGHAESVFQRKYLETGPQTLKRNKLVLLLEMHMGISSGGDQGREPKEEGVGMEFCMPGVIAPKDPRTSVELLLSWVE